MIDCRAFIIHILSDLQYYSCVNSSMLNVKICVTVSLVRMQLTNSKLLTPALGSV